MGDDQDLWPWIEIWEPSASGEAGSPKTLWNQKFPNFVAKMPQAARIPAGYSIVIALQNDSQGGWVSGATWTVLDGSGNSLGSVTYALSDTEGGGVPQGDLSPIASFQVTFGGAYNGAHATFSSGAGMMIYEAGQTMTVDTSYSACIGFTGGTAETSNIGYGALEATSSTMFSQVFRVVSDSAQSRQAKPNARKLPTRPVS
jgi:hypothetical protein